MTGKSLGGATPCNEILQQFIPHKILAPKKGTLGSWENLGSLPVGKNLFAMENFPPGCVFGAVGNGSRTLRTQKSSSVWQDNSKFTLPLLDTSGKKKNRIGGLGCYFNSEQKLGLRSATLWIQSIPELLFPRVQQGWSSRGWALCSLLQLIFSWILPDSASPVLWIGTAKANPFLSTHGMNSSAPNPRFSPWGAAPCCFNGLKQSLELELISSKTWSFPSLEFFQPLKWFSLPSRLHGLCPSWDVEINLFSKFAF